MHSRLPFTGDLSTTAMGILPHEDIDSAMRLALSVDIPFWPQLPRYSFHEDMYVQAMENFPGAVIDGSNQKIFIDTERFMNDIPGYIENEDNEELFHLSPGFSATYRSFMERELVSCKAIRGQMISPVSFTLKIVDENGVPIVYNDEIRALAFNFIQKKVNAQYRQLKDRNNNVFVWVDDPGLEFIFSALSGYDAVRAREEMTVFFDGIEGPRGLHLCGRPDWDFLLSLNIEILSFNAYAFGDIFVTYQKARDFLEAGKIIAWGIVPTYFEEFCAEDIASLSERMIRMWEVLRKKGVAMDRIISGSMLAPATCNLINTDRTVTVERSFQLLNELSRGLKERYAE